ALADALRREALDLAHRLLGPGPRGSERRQRGARLDLLQLRQAGAEIGQLAPRKLGARDELDARRVHRLSVAIHLVMEMRTRREAGRADVADHLPAPHAAAARDRDAAHMRITRGEPAAMRKLDVVAMPAVTAGVLHGAVADR